MRDSGLNVKAIDGSAGLAAEAFRLFGLQVQVLRFEDFHEPDCYDGVWACWSLHHAIRKAFPRLLQRISQSVIPGGYLFFSVKGGTGESLDELSRHYARYEIGELSKMIEELAIGHIVEHESWSAVCYSGATDKMRHLLLRV